MVSEYGRGGIRQNILLGKRPKTESELSQILKRVHLLNLSAFRETTMQQVLATT
jgi:ABC-type transport system involved in cytochrome bd biosynthesis fused ATPase/permease subunit